MPRAPKNLVPRINPVVIRSFYARLPKAGAADYYVLEKGQHAIHWCCLRVKRTQIQIGLRKGQSWYSIAVVPQDVGVEDLETLRDACRTKSRELEDEEAEPTLKEGRRTTWETAWSTFREYYTKRRLPSGSARTLDFYDYLFKTHILPLYGPMTLAAFAALPASRIEVIPEIIAARVREARPHYSGRHTGNHALHAMRMVWERCRRLGWIARDPFLDVGELPTQKVDVYLEDSDLAALGAALRNLEKEARTASEVTRQVPSLNALLALRITLYTGCRHVEELLRGKLSWLRLDYGVTRIEVPQAKGQRHGKSGRFIYLGPDALRCLNEIRRPPGCDDLVPGRTPGTQMNRLTEPWERLMLEARKLLDATSSGQPSAIRSARIVGYRGEERIQLFGGTQRIPVKATRHTLRTILARAGVSPDHARQLLGHQAAYLGDRVYLHEHGASLCEAAAKAEAFIRRLMGDSESSVLHFQQERRRKG